MSSTPRTHPLNVSYLVVGLVFLGIAASWALRTADVVDGRDARWMLPATLVAAGAVGLVAFAAKGLTRGRRRDEDPVVDEPATDAFPFDDDPRSYDVPSDVSSDDTRPFDRGDDGTPRA
jgi:hypothetical protein